MHDRRASPTFLLTHRFHALSDSLIRGGGEGCLELLKEFHALDVVVVAELCHHVFSSSPPVLDTQLAHGRAHWRTVVPPVPLHLVTKCQISLLRGRNCSCFHVFRAFLIIRGCVLRRLLAATGAEWESRCLPESCAVYLYSAQAVRCILYRVLAVRCTVYRV